MSSVLITHPVGNQNVRALLASWQQRACLHSYWTTIRAEPGSRIARLLPGGLRQRWLRRAYPLPAARVHSRPARELVRQVSLACGWKSLTRPETGWASIDQVCQDLDQHVARRLAGMSAPPAVVYGYEDSSVATFEVAHRMGLRCVYEMTIGHHTAAQRILKEEAQLQPEFAPTLEGLEDSSEKQQRKDRELALADRVLASSDFVCETLRAAGVPMEKILVTQFGAPGEIPEASEPGERRRPLRLLFAGRIGQRKGIGYLLQAVARCQRSDVHLILLGEMVGDPQIVQSYHRWFQYERPRSHRDLLRFMQTCDLLVLPTLFEGQALVVLEAMQCSLPVLTTPHSGATSVIRSGIDGFIVPIRSVEALMEKIHWAADHRDELREMGQAARSRAGQFTWQAYAETVTADLQLQASIQP